MIAIVAAIALCTAPEPDAPSLNAATTRASLLPSSSAVQGVNAQAHLLEAPSFTKPVVLFTLAGTMGAATLVSAVAAIATYPRSAPPPPTNIGAALGSALGQAMAEAGSITLGISAGLGALLTTALFVWAGNSWGRYSVDREVYDSELEFARTRSVESLE